MEEIIKKTLLFVPELITVFAKPVHGSGDPHEVLQKLDGKAFVGGVLVGQFESYFEHLLAKECHPGGAVGLLEESTSGQGCATVKDADVIEPQETAFEDVASHGVLAVSPPRKVE
jgi:hypothetical protein